MSKILKSVGLVVCSVWFVTTASAQINGVNIGDSVRVSAQSISHSKIIGVVTSMTPKVISISRNYDQYYLLEIPMGDIQMLEIQREVKNTGRGALIGAGAGGVIVGVIAMAGNKSCGPDEWCVLEFSNGEAFLMGTAVGLFPGALIGAIIGSTIKTRKWKKVPLELQAEPISLSYLNKPPTPGITLRWIF